LLPSIQITLYHSNIQDKMALFRLIFEMFFIACKEWRAVIFRGKTSHKKRTQTGFQAVPGALGFYEIL